MPSLGHAGEDGRRMLTGTPGAQPRVGQTAVWWATSLSSSWSGRRMPVGGEAAGVLNAVHARFDRLLDGG